MLIQKCLHFQGQFINISTRSNSDELVHYTVDQFMLQRLILCSSLRLHRTFSTLTRQTSYRVPSPEVDAGQSFHMNMIHYVVVELRNDHQSEKNISRKSSRPVNQRLKLTLFIVQPAIFTNPIDFSDIHRTDLCIFNFSTVITHQLILAFE